ncbi:MAG: phosphate acyltransferase PlsX [Clostridia bacterium]|nr:phosphate acyltransferase PlsX [Clostridia bacterium]
MRPQKLVKYRKTCYTIPSFKWKDVRALTHIYLDAMGGDNAPGCTVAGAIEALRANKELKITLAGDESAISPLLKDCDDVRSRLTVEHCSETITNHDAPVMAVRTKKDSAVVKGMLAVRDGRADGFVSAGSTGATLAGGMFRLGRIDGIDRPALAPLMPNGKDFFLLIDCGANVDCKPEYLQQFAIMGDAYMRCVRGLKNPRVGLLNIGAEAEKGNQLVKETYPLLEKTPVNFVGNIEGRDVTADMADVIVADGFSGNVLLKGIEGTALYMSSKLKQVFLKNGLSKLAALLVKGGLRDFKKGMDYTEVGGTVFLGIQKPVVKAHGSCNAKAVCSAIRQAVKLAEADPASQLSALLEEAGSGEAGRV